MAEQRWSLRITWRGEAVKHATTEAVKKGIDDTMAAATLDAKRNHPGWRNRTGTAEGSVRLITPAREHPGYVAGVWGSQGVGYVIWLELRHGSFLRNAADQEYPTLASRIRQHMSGAGAIS